MAALRMDVIKRAIPQEKGGGRPNVIRNRADYAEIVCDIVLGRRSMVQIARRIGVSYCTIQRFKDAFCTPDVARVVMAEAQRVESEEVDEKINAAQDDIQKGLREVITEQKDLYRELKNRLGDGRDVEDLAPALSQLLRDQGQSFERLLKSYTALKEKTTIVLSINESPEWAKLQGVLFEVFEAHPDSFDTFRQLVEARRLRLE